MPYYRIYTALLVYIYNYVMKPQQNDPFLLQIPIFYLSYLQDLYQLPILLNEGIHFCSDLLKTLDLGLGSTYKSVLRVDGNNQTLQPLNYVFLINLLMLTYFRKYPCAHNIL